MFRAALAGLLTLGCASAGLAPASTAATAEDNDDPLVVHIDTISPELPRSGDVEICVKDPGYDTDAVVVAELRAFTEVVLGRRTLAAALRQGCVKLLGTPAMLRTVRAALPLHGEAMQSMGLVP